MANESFKKLLGELTRVQSSPHVTEIAEIIALILNKPKIPTLAEETRNHALEVINREEEKAQGSCQIMDPRKSRTTLFPQLYKTICSGIDKTGKGYYRENPLPISALTTDQIIDTFGTRKENDRITMTAEEWEKEKKLDSETIWLKPTEEHPFSLIKFTYLYDPNTRGIEKYSFTEIHEKQKTKKPTLHRQEFIEIATTIFQGATDSEKGDSRENPYQLTARLTKKILREIKKTEELARHGQFKVTRDQMATPPKVVWLALAPAPAPGENSEFSGLIQLQYWSDPETSEITSCKFEKTI